MIKMAKSYAFLSGQHMACETRVTCKGKVVECRAEEQEAKYTVYVMQHEREEDCRHLWSDVQMQIPRSLSTGCVTPIMSQELSPRPQNDWGACLAGPALQGTHRSYAFHY